MMRIDAHQHYWSLAWGGYAWLGPARPVINRDFLPGDLAPLLAHNGVDQSVVVQSIPTLAETEFLLTLAENEATIAGIVGWVDLASSSVLDDLERLAEHDKFLGIRLMAQPEPDPDWIAQPEFQPALNKLASLGKSLDVLVLGAHLPALERLVARHPDLQVLINHTAKPAIADGVFESWSLAMRGLADKPNTFCKLSGLTAVAGPESSANDLAHFVKEVIAAFSPNRTIWGSDWPVLNETSTYENWVAITDGLLASLAPEEQAQILGGNAITAYRLPQTKRRQ